MAESRRNRDPEQTHNHEILGSVELAEIQEDPHNHRFATVTGSSILRGMNDHVHRVEFRTDFYEDHIHRFSGETGGAIRVGDRHVHYLRSRTEASEGHRHEFRAATLIDNPIED